MYVLKNIAEIARAIIESIMTTLAEIRSRI